MSFTQMPTENVAIRSLIYNDTTFCMRSLIRDRAFKYCQQISFAVLYERVAQILWQVNKTFLKQHVFPGHNSKCHTIFYSKWHSSIKWYMDRIIWNDAK